MSDEVATTQPKSAEETKPAVKKITKAEWVLKMLPDLDPTMFAVIAGRAATREATASKIIHMGENAANAAKAPGDSLAHGVSAHGPGTDQMPRLVTGRRADEVVEEPVSARPTTAVNLTAGPAGPIDMPAWTEVGNDPSNVSSRFGSATQMLSAVEEAFAQAALIQSMVAAETRELDRKAMEIPEVQQAAEALGKARTAANAARGEATRASELLQSLVEAAEAENKKSAGTEAALAAAAKVEPARLQLEAKAGTYRDKSQLIESAIADLRAAKAKAAPGARSGLGDDRMKLVVEPGGTIGESFKVGDDQKALKTGDALTPQQMQERYGSVAQTADMRTATMIMDPSFVVDEFGQKHRAGVQIQTAFPSAGDKPQRELSQAGFDAMVTQEKAEAALKPVREELRAAKQKSATTIEDREQAKLKIGSLREDRTKVGTQKDTFDPEFMSADDKVDLFATMGADKQAEFMALLTAEDVGSISGDGKTVSPGKEHDALTLAVAALKKRQLSLDAEIKDTDTLEKTLATTANDLLKTIAAKETQIKAAEALTATTASGTEAAATAAEIKAAKEAETAADAELADMAKARSDARLALESAPAELPQEERRKLEAAVAAASNSAAASTERSAVRRLKAAREATLKAYGHQQQAAATLVQDLTTAKSGATDALTAATKLLNANPAPTDPKPKETDFTTGPVGKQKADYKKAESAWTRKDTAYTNAAAGVTNATLKLTEIDLKLTDATTALTTLNTEIDTLTKRIVKTSADEATALKKT